MPEFTIGRLRGGFAVSWHEDGKRRRYQLAARTRKAAEAEAIDIIRRETAPVGGQTVADIWALYLDARKGRHIHRVMSHAPAVLAHFGHLRPDQITAEHCHAFTAKRRRDGMKDGTIWTEAGWLRTALQWAAKPGRRLIPEAPEIERPAKPAPKDRWLTHGEIDRLLAAATTPHVRLAIVLMLTTAARVGAVLDLRWDRVSFERGQIDLRVDATGPRKGRAVVPMNRMARAALQTAREAALSDYVVEWAGGPVKSIRKGFVSACEAAGLKDVTPHSVRHTAAVHMAAAGIPISKISQFLGHSNEAITARVYARFAPDHLREAGDVLDFSASTIRAVK